MHKSNKGVECRYITRRTLAPAYVSVQLEIRAIVRVQHLIYEINFTLKNELNHRSPNNFMLFDCLPDWLQRFPIETERT